MRLISTLCLVLALALASCKKRPEEAVQLPVHRNWQEVPSAMMSREYERQVAIIIGTDNYQNMGDLSHSFAGAKRLAGILEASYGYASEHCFLLENPTKAELNSAIESVHELSLNDEDSLLFFFSGHGIDVDGKGFVAVSDSPENWSEWIAIDSLVTILGEIQTNRALILDCCYSGSLFNDHASSAASSNTAFVGLSASASTIASSGIRFTEEGTRLSFLASALVNQLSGHVANDEDRRHFAFSELANSVETEVSTSAAIRYPEMSKRLIETQRPDWGTIGGGHRNFYFNPRVVPPKKIASVKFIDPFGSTVRVFLDPADETNFLIGSIPCTFELTRGNDYRLEVEPFGRKDIKVYPILSIPVGNKDVDELLTTNAVPIHLREAELVDSASMGLRIVKVFYLPDAEHQELQFEGVEGPKSVASMASAGGDIGLGTVVLDPGVDPVLLAQLRGDIVAIVSFGDKQLEKTDGLPNVSGLEHYNFVVSAIAADEATQLLDDQDFEAAEVCLNEAIGILPDDPWLYMLRGIAKGLDSRFISALSDFDRYVELVPDDSLGYLQRARCYMDLKDFLLAIPDLEYACRLQPTFETYYLLAESYIATEKLQNGLVSVTNAIELDPKNPLGFELRSTVHRLLGNKSESDADFKNATKLQRENSK